MYKIGMVFSRGTLGRVMATLVSLVCLTSSPYWIYTPPCTKLEQPQHAAQNL